MTMTISEKGVLMIEGFEGFRSNTYLDQRGIMTIGYGTTADVTPDMTITQPEAEQRLRDDLEYFGTQINNVVRVPITQNQFDALSSFVYNLGVAALIRSHLLKFLNQGDYQNAADEFLRWNIAAGQVNTGLTARRVAERELFLS